MGKCTDQLSHPAGDVFQNEMSMDRITALQGGMCDIIQKEFYVFIFDESANILSY